MRTFSLRLFLPLAVLLAASVRGYGCAACMGNSDSAMAVGMAWGIMTLLVVVGGVLVGIAAFFVYLARRAASVSESASVGQFTQQPKKFA